MEHVFRIVQSPLGPLRLVSSDAALVALAWEDHAGVPAADVEMTPSPVLDEVERQLSAYFAGKLHRFDLPLCPRGTGFQHLVWNVLRTIAFGETRSYAEVAQALGAPKACRAVGAANGRNPLPIIVPCHRVIGSNGKLTGFSGGLFYKAALLDHERQHLHARRALLPAVALAS
jgi:methylated-DNA-[protein]-cysteine S-methyltransferase